MKKVPLIVSIIIVILIIAVVGFFAYKYYGTQKTVVQQQNQNLNKQTTQIAGWKTYTNTQYGFEFQYPNNVSVGGAPNASLNLGLLTLALKENNAYQMWFYVLNQDQKEALDKIINPDKASDLDTKTGQKLVNGVDWITTETLSPPINGIGTAGSVLNYHVQTDNNIYDFQCINCNVEMFGDFGTKEKNLFDSVVETFKFIK